MNHYGDIREAFMNCSRTILPRVGVGVGGGGEVGNACIRNSLWDRRPTRRPAVPRSCMRLRRMGGGF